jgi:VIT1/CCC1 family predicted Fe2+/Mn2+ transporter
MKLPSVFHQELHADASASRLNWLRAGVLGANDGIVSLAALLVGIAGASADQHNLLVAGVAGVLAGALSMAVGEYVSVSSQRDTERVLFAKERKELEMYPEAELEELTTIYQKKGLERATAEIVAKELTAVDAFGTHVREELGISPDELTNPWHAAIASAVSFFAGAMIPVVAILIPPATLQIPVTFAAVLVALVITGVVSARVSGAPTLKVTLRVVLGGILAMIVTFGIGKLFGIVGI